MTPIALHRPCRHPGCPSYAMHNSSMCPAHTRAKQRERDTAHERGYSYKWHQFRTQYLKENPLCLECLKAGLSTPATEVDHITPHNGNERLMWGEENLQPLCKRHHSQKTARYDGGFGRRKKK